VQSALRPTVPAAIVDSMISSTIGAWTTINTAAVDYWIGALSRRATPIDLTRDLTGWTTTMAARERPTWAHDNSIIKEWPLARLRDYSAPNADPAMVATVILPPQAGHDSSIVDFAEGQSQIIVGRESGCHRIYSLDWIGATPQTKDATVDQYMSLLRETAELLGGKVNLVGDCQGGWLATLFAALHPEMVNSLAIAGAPIDFHAGEPLIHDWLTLLAPNGDMSYFRAAVSANDGVLPGRFLLDGFKALQPDNEFSRSLALLANMHNAQHVERYRKFENWFQWTQSIPGAFYLWVVEHLFIRNSLIRGELVVEGRTVDLAEINCPLFLMAGKTDHITPADQVWALADYATTSADRIGRHSATSGHLGLFMSHEALTSHWPVIFTEMAGLSTPTPNDEPNVLTDEPTNSHRTDTAAAKMERQNAAAQIPGRKGGPPRKVSRTTGRARSSAGSKSSTSTSGSRSTAQSGATVAAPKAPALKALEATSAAAEVATPNDSATRPTKAAVSAPQTTPAKAASGAAATLDSSATAPDKKEPAKSVQVSTK